MLIVLESGEYSDRCVEAVVEAPENANLTEMQVRWKDTLTQEEIEGFGRYGGGSNFLAWLLRQPGWNELPFELENYGTYGGVDILRNSR